MNIFNRHVYQEFITLLLSIDDKFRDNFVWDPKKKYVFDNSPQYNTQPAVHDPERIMKEVEGREKKLPGKAKTNNTFSTIKNILYNGIDNTLGYPIALYQNANSRRELKGDKKKRVVYIENGVFQNRGAGWRLARELKSQGYIPYHLAGSHFFGGKVDNSVKKSYQQIEGLHKYAGISKQDAAKRNDVYTGHSHGANVGIHMAARNETPDYGIKHIQARAPTPYGLHFKNIYQKALGAGLDAKSENRKYKEAKEEAAKVYNMNPVVPVHIIAGKNDKLVPPNNAYYIKSKSFKILDHKDSGHFGTSGVNASTNKIFVDELKAYSKPDDHVGVYKKAA